MRIIAGAWRGRPLLAPPGKTTRPTLDRAREGLFSMLASRIGSLEGLRIADLFAGTGALGLEGLSRGAAHCVFIEADPSALAALKRNVAALGAEDRSEVRAQAAEHSAPPALPRDLVLMDPPYASDLAQAALERIADPRWLAPGGWASVERGRSALEIPDAFDLDVERRFGKASILLLRRKI